MASPETPPVAESVVEQVAQLWLTADELEATGKAPWHGKQPIEEFAKDWKGRPWVPLEAAIAQLQFWQRRDYEHACALAAIPRPIEDETPTDAGEGVEPVAWMYRAGEREDPVFDWKQWGSDAIARGWVETPLYAHPAPTDTGLVGELVEALEKARDSVFFVGEPGQIVEIDALIAKAKDTPHG